MNYMVMTLLCDQFAKLNKDFSKCISDRRQFSGNFEQFRCRHQEISRSVQEADRFLMMSNGANFCCQVANIILFLYSALFYREDIMSMEPWSVFTGLAVSCSLEPWSAILYIVFLLFSVFILSLVAKQAIILNDAVSFYYHYIIS